MKRILVTGGAGLLGGHLCRRLLEEGHEVVCLDNFYSSTPDSIEDLHAYPRFEFIEQDIQLPFDIEVEQIYNLACPASPPHYQRDPVETAKINFFGALNMLELARRHGATLLQASTSEVYGDPVVHPQPEDYWGNVNPVGVRSCYDEGKRFAETLCRDYHRQYGTAVKIARIFNTYGPRMHPEDGRVVSNFILQALRGVDITLYGDGSQTRCFCYVDDMVEGFTRLMNSPAEFTGPVNLGNPGEHSVRQLAELILELTGSASRLVYKPLPQDDPQQREPDIRLAKQALGWEPTVKLRHGLGKTIEWFDALLSAKAAS